MSQPPPLSPILRAYYKWKSIRFPWRRQFLVGLDLKNNTYWEFRDRGTPTPTQTENDPSSSSSYQNFRWRRIVYPPPSSKLHPSEIQISPAWHQWLRHTRRDPPSLSEQAADVIRQERIKALGAQADARWAAKPRYVDAPPTPSSSPTAPVAAAVGQGVRQPPLVGGGMVAEQKVREEEGKKDDEQGKPSGNGNGEEEGGGGRANDQEGRELNAQRQKAWKEMRAQEGKQGKNDPWKQAAMRKGGPGEEWQPQAWTPPASKR